MVSGGGLQNRRCGFDSRPDLHGGIVEWLGTSQQN